MIAAAATGQLLIGKEDRAMRRTFARGGDGVGVGGSRDGDKMQLPGKESAGEIGFESGEIEH